MRVHPIVTALVVVLSACGASEGADDATGTAASSETVADRDRFPDVVDAELTRAGDSWTVAATISSPYDGPDRYADAFRVVAADGTVLGVRELLHPHADEQPFTRTLRGVRIGDRRAEVTVEARDSVNGWGGASVSLSVPDPP